MFDAHREMHWRLGLDYVFLALVRRALGVRIRVEGKPRHEIFLGPDLGVVNPISMRMRDYQFAASMKAPKVKHELVVEHGRGVDGHRYLDMPKQPGATDQGCFRRFCNCGDCLQSIVFAPVADESRPHAIGGRPRVRLCR